ncbi:hypothetical protein BaRGS_00010660 [Batillaria attramentaria]|uniref:Uncharacterized protein n=1 Tax=Batillaria attramentaria TaxID=370345 RepID=A0ABD0LG90_9CAEN
MRFVNSRAKEITYLARQPSARIRTVSDAGLARQPSARIRTVSDAGLARTDFPQNGYFQRWVVVFFDANKGFNFQQLRLSVSVCQSSDNTTNDRYQY